MAKAKTPTPPALALDLELAGLLQRQNDQIRQQAYTALGVLSKVHVETAGVAVPVANKFRSAGLEWYGKQGLCPQCLNQPAKVASCLACRRSGHIEAPGVAFGAAGDLLIVGALPHPPAIPDPTYQPTPRYTEPEKNAAGQVVRGPELVEASVAPRMVAQNPADFADCVVNLGGAPWLVFQPVHGILIHSLRGGFCVVDCKPDPQGRHTVLLWDPRTLRAHLLYGRYEIQDHTAQGRQSLGAGGFGGAPGSVQAFLDAEALRQKKQAPPAVQAVKDAAHGRTDPQVEALLRR